MQFRDVPAYYNVDLESISSPLDTPLGSKQAAAFLQEWLFFGALNSICRAFDVQFDPMDFVLEIPECGSVITGLQFHKYVCFWVGGTEVGLYQSTIGRLNKQRDEVVFILKFVEKTTQAWTEFEDVMNSLDLDLVLLSLSQLANHLRKIFSHLLASPLINSRSLGLLHLYPRHGRQLLLKAGWCIGELPALISRYSPSVLLYLSTLDRARDEKDHSRCRDDACVANQLNSEYYKTAHTTGCRGPGSCDMIYAPVEQICAILEAGDIPLVAYSEDSHTSRGSLQVATFRLSNEQELPEAADESQYVAISHVWSDGMGNPESNALHACQLRRVQRAVNNLGTISSSSAIENRLLWLDTLCVPLDPRFRTLAIIRMARTYLHASSVLVLDNWLMQDSISQSGPKRVLCKLVHSDWNTRVWTFQEAVLARACYIQLADGAVTIEQLVATTGNKENVRIVSRTLSGIEERELLNKEYTLNLIRALVHLDPLAIERNEQTYSTAALPPQENPNEDLNRLIAMQAEYAYKSRCEVLSKWFPVLARAGDSSGNIEADTTRLNALIWPLNLDPVCSHIEVLAMLIRGFGFEFIMERSEDLKGQRTRQLRGFTSEPGIILPEMIAGIRSRTTSWKEDETICLGGVIGIDVSPLALVRVNHEKREEEQHRVCEERMKIFLASVKTFPESILFLTSKRLTQYPWKWAPASFLGNEEKSWLLEQIRAEYTEDGLLVTCPGIIILPSPDVVKPDTEVIKLRFRMPFNPRFRAIRPDDVYGEMLIKIRTSSSTEQDLCWHSLCAQHDGDLVLLTTSNITEKSRDAILARHIGTKNDVRLLSYVANIIRVRRAFLDSDPCIIGTMEPRKTRWCIG